MKRLLMFTISAVGIAFIYSISPRPAHAYLDPGTGSYIFQILIAGLVGGLFAVKIFWKRIKAFLIKVFRKEENSESNTDNE